MSNSSERKTRTTNTKRSNTKNTSARSKTERNGDTRTSTTKRTGQRGTSTKVRARKSRIDWVSVFFLLISIYLGVHIIFYATKEKYPTYQVPRAEDVSDNYKYQGMILRNEVCFTTENEGYINYYIASGRRAAAGAIIYTLDKDGQFSQMLLSSTGETENLSKSDMKKIVKRLQNLQQAFNGMDFQEVYDAKNAISAVVMDYLTAAAIETLNETMGISGFTKVSSDRSGVISFTSDNYDQWTEGQLTLAALNGEEYTKTVSTAGDNRKVGEFAYKVITDETFQVYFPITEKEARDYGLDLQVPKAISVRVYLPKIEQTVNAEMTLVRMSDENLAGKLSFAKYGSNYIDDRYLEFEIVKEQIYGMKIPATAVVQKDFIMIPVDFITTGADSNAKGVLKKTVSGEPVFVTFDAFTVETEVTQDEDGNVVESGWYYVRTQELGIGDILVKTESEKEYQIISTAPVTGVYQTNQGYTEFKIVKILKETEDNKYYIVQPKMSFGIAAFDYIIVEANKVEEGQILE